MKITKPTKGLFREEILDQRQHGCSYREISSLLGLNLSTVRYHLDNNFRERVIHNAREKQWKKQWENKQRTA